jgi:hypothetical protein
MLILAVVAGTSGFGWRDELDGIGERSAHAPVARADIDEDSGTGLQALGVGEEGPGLVARDIHAVHLPPDPGLGKLAEDLVAGRLGVHGVPLDDLITVDPVHIVRAGVQDAGGLGQGRPGQK